VRFWDSLAVVPLLVAEAATDVARTALREDAAMIVWRLTGTEIISALFRRRRAEEIDEAGVAAAQRRLAALEARWTAVEDLDPVVRRARRLLSTHSLRSADALQLAAALIACDEHPELLPLVTLDDRLAQAARREGFAVVP
jgi:uncharacterized protein